MHFDVLGPLRVEGPDGAVPVPGGRARAALSWLVANANEPVGLDSLAGAVWTRPPADAAKLLRMLVRSTAVLLPPGVLSIDSTARLVVADGAVDAVRFEQLIRAGRSHRDVGADDRATANVEAALSLWRGSPYPDLARSTLALAEIDRLCELRIDAIEIQQDVIVAGPVDFTVIADLRYLAQVHADRRAFRHQLARALYLTGRQVEALETLRLASAELGDDPQTQRLTTAILRHDPELRPADQ